MKKSYKFIIYIFLIITSFETKSQWLQLPVTTGPVSIFFSNKNSNKFIVSSKQIFEYYNNKWNKIIHEGLPDTITTDIVDGITFNDNLIVGTSYPNAGFYKFNKSNNKWNLLNFIINDTFYIKSIKYVNNRIYVGILTFPIYQNIPTVIYSEDNGNSWIADDNGIIAKGLEHLVDIVFYENEYYLLTNSRIYKKNTLDTAWQLLMNGINNISLFNISNILTHKQNLFISSNRGVFKFDNASKNWLPFNNGILSSDTSLSGIVAEVNKKLITFKRYSVGRKTYFWDESTEKWELVPLLFDSIVINSATSINDTLFIATNQGLQLLNDINEMPKLFMNGVNNVSINSIVINNNNLLATSFNTGFFYYNRGLISLPQFLQKPYFSSINTLDTNQNLIFTGYSNGLGIYNKNMELQYFEPMFHGRNVRRLYAHNNKIFASVGQGSNSENFVADAQTLTWQKINLNTQINDYFYHDGYVYAASNTTGLYRTDTASLNNWEFISGTFGPQQINGISASGNIIYVTTPNGLNTYNTITKEWGKINTPFDNLGLRRIICVNNKIILNTSQKAGIYIADTSDFIFYPLYNGINTNLLSVNNMLIHQDTLFLATTQGIWYRPLSDINTGLAQTNLKSKTSINIYPNPASGLINIETKTERIKQIKLYNLQGKQVESYDVNNDKFMINTEYFVPGVYMIQAILNNNELVHQKVVFK
ncbi:MAG: T9SS type A sorting domain-containing protein [Bacteroidia bacterium]